MVNEYTTLALVQAELRADTVFSSSTTPTSTQVTTWIQEASNEIELRSGQIYSSVVVSSSYFDYDGSGIFRYPHKPLISITKVEYNNTSSADTPEWLELEEGYDKNYLEYLDEGEIEFVSGVNATNKKTPLSGKKKFRMSYVYGYDSTPLYVQRLATLMVAQRTIMSLAASQSNTEGGSVQVGTIMVSDPSNYSLTYIKGMKEEINNLFSQLGSDSNTFVINRLYD